jgi:hypothetical protein
LSSLRCLRFLRLLLALLALLALHCSPLHTRPNRRPLLCARKVKLFAWPCTKAGAAFDEYRGHASHVTCVRWAADDSRLLSTGGGDRCVMQWRFVNHDGTDDDDDHDDDDDNDDDDDDSDGGGDGDGGEEAVDYGKGGGGAAGGNAAVREAEAMDARMGATVAGAVSEAAAAAAAMAAGGRGHGDGHEHEHGTDSEPDDWAAEGHHGYCGPAAADSGGGGRGSQPTAPPPAPPTGPGSNGGGGGSGCGGGAGRGIDFQLDLIRAAEGRFALDGGAPAGDEFMAIKVPSRYSTPLPSPPH